MQFEQYMIDATIEANQLEEFSRYFQAILNHEPLLDEVDDDYDPSGACWQPRASKEDLIDEVFAKVCSQGNVQMLKVILQYSTLENLEIGMLLATMEDHHEIVTEIIHSRQEVNLNYSGDRLLFICCENDAINTLSYVLPAFKGRINYRQNGDEALMVGVRSNSLQVVNYLLSSPSLGEHCCLRSQGDKAIIQAIEHNHMDMVKTLILDYAQPKTLAIEQMMKELLNHKKITQAFVEDINTWFARTQQYWHMQASLHMNTPQVRRKGI